MAQRSLITQFEDKKLQRRQFLVLQQFDWLLGEALDQVLGKLFVIMLYFMPQITILNSQLAWFVIIMVYWHHVNTDKHIEERVVGPIKPSRQRYPSDQKLYIGIDSFGTLTLIQCKYCFVVTKDSSSLQEGFPAILSWVIANKNADLVISKTAPSLPLICSEWFCQLAIALNCYRPASSCKIFAKTWLDPQSKMGHCPKHNGGLDNTQHIIFLHIPLFPIFNVRLTMLSHTQDLLNAHFEGYET